MLDIISLKQFYTDLYDTNLQPALYLREIQKSLKNLLGNTEVAKLLVSINQPECYCSKSMNMQDIVFYESKLEAKNAPEVFSYTTPFDGEGQINVYLKKDHETTKNDVQEIEFLCQLLYSLLERSYTKKLLIKTQDFDPTTGVLSMKGLKNVGKMVLDKKLMPKFAVIFMNIINFKTINDEYGHEAGDLFLKEYAQKVSFFLEKDGSIARLGGDTFAILVKKTILAKVLKFLQEVKVTIEYEDKTISADISVRAGITEGNRNLPIFDAYLGCAQTALKSALQENVDDFVFF